MKFLHVVFFFVIRVSFHLSSLIDISEMVYETSNFDE
jgi:hypothetical protein